MVGVGGVVVVDGFPEGLGAYDLVHVPVGLGSVFADAGDEDLAGAVLEGAVDLNTDAVVAVLGNADFFWQVGVKVSLYGHPVGGIAPRLGRSL